MQTLMLWGGRSRVAVAIALGAATLALLSPTSAPAQVLRPEVRFPFLADPLADDPRDPLLPTPPVARPLSPLEKLALEQDLDALAQRAAALDAAGDLEGARRLWQREVRLRRLLGVVPEVAAIDRVARVLRDRSVTQDLQLYRVRLDEIRAPLALPADRAFLDTLADTYAVLGDNRTAAALRRQLADDAQTGGDRPEYRRQLEALAPLHADWFEFAEAAAVYGELVALAQAEGDRALELDALARQADNRAQMQDLPGAIALHQRLLRLYQEDAAQWSQIPSLQLRVAAHHRTLGDLETASRQYQAAYTNAIDQGQLEVAARAIVGLADLYKTLNRWRDVGYLYEQLLVVAQRSHNAFTMMTAYDELGQVHEQLQNPALALAAYREGLGLARLLGIQQDYFQAQIDRLTEGAS